MTENEKRLFIQNQRLSMLVGTMGVIIDQLCICNFKLEEKERMAIWTNNAINEVVYKEKEMPKVFGILDSKSDIDRTLPECLIK